MLLKDSVKPLPAIFIGKEKISQRIKLFQQRKHALLSEEMSSYGQPRQETKSIWYSKEHLETLLAEMSLTNADGMRVYFGAYEAEAGMLADQLCLLMVLTRPGSGSNTHNDIILEREPDFADRKQQLTARSIDIEPGDADGRPREYNYGAPCPPICLTDEPGFPED